MKTHKIRSFETVKVIKVDRIQRNVMLSLIVFQHLWTVLYTTTSVLDHFLLMRIMWPRGPSERDKCSQDSRGCHEHLLNVQGHALWLVPPLCCFNASLAADTFCLSLLLHSCLSIYI